MAGWTGNRIHMSKKAATPKRGGSSGTPTCSCLVLCDDVVISHGRDKHRLEGIIGSMNVPFVPHPIAGSVVYVRISNVHQHEKVSVSLVRADDNQPLWVIEAEIVNLNEPLNVHTLVAKVPPFMVDKAGRHLLEAKHKGVPIASVPIMIQAAFPSPPPGWPIGAQSGENNP